MPFRSNRKKQQSINVHHENTSNHKAVTGKKPHKRWGKGKKKTTQLDSHATIPQNQESVLSITKKNSLDNKNDKKRVMSNPKHSTDENRREGSTPRVQGKVSFDVAEDSSSSTSEHAERCTPVSRVSNNPTGKESTFRDISKLTVLQSQHNKKVLEEYQKIPHRKKNESTYGTFRTTFDYGECIMKGTMNANKTPTGLCEFYASTPNNNSPGNLLAIVSYDDNGNIDGKELRFHSNGALQVRSSYKKGIKEGKELTYYDNGSIKSIKTYYNNIIAGNPECTYEPAHIEYYKTGIPSMRVSYNEDGKKEGLTLLMDTKGRIIEKQWYEDGEPARIWETISYQNGHSTPHVTKTEHTDESIDILDDCQYLPKDYEGEIDLVHDEYGLLHGEQVYKTTLAVDNSDETEIDIIKKVRYQHGIKDGETRIESDDNERRLLSTITYKAGLKTKQSIYEDTDDEGYEIEIKSYERQMKYGLEHGTTVKEIREREWDDDDIELCEDACSKAEVEYRFGQKDGTTKYYDEDNKLRRASQYQAGKLDGIAIDYYKDGRHIESITEYHNDEKNGVEIDCDIDGNITTIKHYVNGEQNGHELCAENGKVVKTTMYKNGKNTECEAFDLGTGRKIR